MMNVVKIAVFYVLLFSLIPKKVVANDESTGVPSKYMICFSLYFCICLFWKYLHCQKKLQKICAPASMYLFRLYIQKSNGSVRDYKYWNS